MYIVCTFEFRLTIAKLTTAHTLLCFSSFHFLLRFPWNEKFISTRFSFSEHIAWCQLAPATTKNTTSNLFMNSHNIMSFRLKMHIEWQTLCINTDSSIYFTRRRPTHEICDAVFVNMSLFSSILFWCYDSILGRCVSHVEQFFSPSNRYAPALGMETRCYCSKSNACCWKVSNISCINIKITNNEIYFSFSADFYNLDVRRKELL